MAATGNEAVTLEQLKSWGSSVLNGWERSPIGGSSANFCVVYYDGSANFIGASGGGGLSPFGCI